MNSKDSQPASSSGADTPNPPKRPRVPAAVYHYHSSLDVSRGPLRTTSDGNLINEDSGEWLLLDAPPHDRENRKSEKPKKNAPTIGLPESKNGADGLEDACSRDGVTKMMKRVWSGSVAKKTAAKEEDEKGAVKDTKAAINAETEDERVDSGED